MENTFFTCRSKIQKIWLVIVLSKLLVSKKLKYDQTIIGYVRILHIFVLLL